VESGNPAAAASSSPTAGTLASLRDGRPRRLPCPGGRRPGPLRGLPRCPRRGRRHDGVHLPQVPHRTATPAGAHTALPAQGLPDSPACGPASVASPGAPASASASAGASPPRSPAPLGSPGAGRGPHQDPAPLRALQGRAQRAARPLPLPLPPVRRRPRRGCLKAPPFPCSGGPWLHPAPTAAHAAHALPANDASPSGAHGPSS
jgi:hypothetical protein